MYMTETIIRGYVKKLSYILFNTINLILIILLSVYILNLKQKVEELQKNQVSVTNILQYQSTILKFLEEDNNDCLSLYKEQDKNMKTILNRGVKK